MRAGRGVPAGKRTADPGPGAEALRRTAVSCYACEGAYPPDVAYMQEHYGLQYDSAAYTVRYELFASNLMPDITVLENVP